jgi:membrane glycosyltransferase
LRLLGAAGLHPVSRFHLFQGAAAYLMSPAWFVLLVFWALLGRDAETNVIHYFSETNPLFPNWPPAMTHIDSAVFLLVMYAMLLAPKFTGAGIIMSHRKARRIYGGARAFVPAFLIELAFSVAYAPILMIQQTKSVARAILTKSSGWAPQRRDARAYPLRTLLSFHWLETLIGVLLCVGLASGLVSLWLSPIVFSLTFAVPLSAMSALRLSANLPKALRLESPHSLREPAILTRARAARSELATHMAAE